MPNKNHRILALMVKFGSGKAAYSVLWKDNLVISLATSTAPLAHILLLVTVISQTPYLRGIIFCRLIKSELITVQENPTIDH